MNPSRRAALAFAGALLLLAGCSGAPPPSYPRLSYSYLRPLRLNVAALEIDDSWVPQSGDDISFLSPEQPVDALRQMAHDRLVVSGSLGRAVFRIEDASIFETHDRLDGHLAVRLDIYTAQNKRTAYAEASVSRSVAAPEGRGEVLRAALYALTKQMMDQMNVEFEFQARRGLHDWLQQTSAPDTAIPAPVEQQTLPGAPDGATPTLEAPPATTSPANAPAPTSPAPTSLAPPSLAPD